MGPIVSIARDAKEHILLKQFLAQEEIPITNYKNLPAQQRFIAEISPSNQQVIQSQDIPYALRQQMLSIQADLNSDAIKDRLCYDQLELERKMQHLSDLPATTILVQNNDRSGPSQKPTPVGRKKASIDGINLVNSRRSSGNNNNQPLPHNQHRLKQFRPI